MTTTTEAMAAERAAFEAWYRQDLIDSPAHQDPKKRAFRIWQASAAQAEAKPADTEKLIAAAITRAGLTLVKTANGYEVRKFGRIEAQAAPAASAQVPHPASERASKAIDAELEVRGWPTNTKNAARAGYVAATRLMAAAPAAPAPLTDEQIDIVALITTGFDGVGTQEMNAHDIRNMARAAIAASKGGGKP